ncbi:MAG TPA: RT0821/Lpp0805 family surface protein [Gammaproteobacteria bacterium]
MKRTAIAPLAIAALLLAAQPALADPDKNESGHRQGKHEKHGDKHAKKGKGHKAARFERGAPPPWAPAHGYRRDQQAAETPSQVVAATPYNPEFEARAQADSARVSNEVGTSRGTCNRDKIGTVLGAVAGGVIGNRTASEENRTVATVAGVVIGGIVGNTIGKTMDKRDEQCTGQTLERVGDNQTVAWKNSTNGQEYQVTPVRTYSQEGGLYCREYVTRTAGATRAETTQNACRHPDGSWRMVN